MAELGLEADETHVNNHKAYIQSWISELKMIRKFYLMRLRMQMKL